MRDTNVVPLDVTWLPVVGTVIVYVLITLQFTNSPWVIVIGSGLLGTTLNELIIWYRDKDKPKKTDLNEELN